MNESMNKSIFLKWDFPALCLALSFLTVFKNIFYITLDFSWNWNGNNKIVFFFTFYAVEVYSL